MAVAVIGGYRLVINGLVTASYLTVEVVWAVAGQMFGALATHYFASAERNTP